MADVSRYETVAKIVDWLGACKHRRHPRHCFVGAVLGGLTLFAMNSPAQSESTSSVERFTFRRIEMGVEFRIEVYGCDSRAANKAATAAFDRVRLLNAVMSDYTPDSEVRRLCDGDHRQRPVSISADLYRVLEESVSRWEETDGAFDVTVGPLTKLWRRARRRGEMPPVQ
jgi:thiamine biosynthesis lipoprotein